MKLNSLVKKIALACTTVAVLTTANVAFASYSTITNCGTNYLCCKDSSGNSGTKYYWVMEGVGSTSTSSCGDYLNGTSNSTSCTLGTSGSTIYAGQTTSYTMPSSLPTSSGSICQYTASTS